MAIKVLDGQQFGQLTVIRHLKVQDKTGRNHSMVECKCSCGALKRYKPGELVLRGIRSCDACRLVRGKTISMKKLRASKIETYDSYSNQLQKSLDTSAKQALNSRPPLTYYR